MNEEKETLIMAQEVEKAEKATKNFRNIPEIEHFYRFVHENDMRREAMLALNAVVSRVISKRKKNSRQKRH